MTLCRGWLTLGCLFLTIAEPAPAETSSIGPAIRAEAHKQSRIAATVHVLADTFGPRLTATRNHEAAARWALDELASYGLANAHLESWNFGHLGWVNVRASGAITFPVFAPLAFAPAAWSPGTSGRMSGEAVLIDPPDAPTRQQLDSFLASTGPRVRGRIVLVGKTGPEELGARPPLWRLDDRMLAEILDPAKSSEIEAEVPGVLQPSDVDVAIDDALRAHGALLRVNPSRTPGGVIVAGRNRRFDLSRQIPTVTMSDSDYGRIIRLMQDGRAVRLAFDILNRTEGNGTSYNAIADIPGTDPTAGIVMFGAHLDSWHVATGATDDGVGCAIMMEVARILASLPLRPRRTLRIALWSGEEQGLLGSQDYVARHFGTAEVPRPAFPSLAAYVNIDGGTGRVRAANVFGPPAAASMLREALAPLADLGFVGVVPHQVRRLGATDATTFSRAGLAAIGLIQDPLDYPATHHTNIDTGNHLQIEDAEQAAIVAATLLYDLAANPDPVPRFAPAAMPRAIGPPPEARPTEAAHQWTNLATTSR